MKEMYVKLKQNVAGKSSGLSYKDSLLKPKGLLTQTRFVKKAIYVLDEDEVKYFKEKGILQEKFEIISKEDFLKQRQAYASHLENEDQVDTMSQKLVEEKIYTSTEAEKLLKAEQIALLKKRYVEKKDVGADWGKEQDRVDKILETNPKAPEEKPALGDAGQVGE